MRRKILIIILVIAMVFSLGIPGVSAEGEINGTLRVRLTVDTPEARRSSISFTIDGNYAVEGNDKVKLERKQYTVKNLYGKLYLYYGSSRLCGGDTTLRLAQLKATEGLNNVIILYNAIHKTNYGYLGDIQFIADSKYIQVINHIYIEDYLYGVVPYEMSESDKWPIEALKAQAVAARNYTVKRLGRSGNWDLTDDSSKDQVYKGYKPSTVRCIEAVDATKGQVLVSGTTVIDAFYSASNGGWTELPYHRWGGGANWNYYRVDYDPYDIANPSSRYQTITIPVVIDEAHPVTVSTNRSGTINWANAVNLIKKAILDSGQLSGVTSINDFTLTGVDDIVTTGDADIPAPSDADIPAPSDADIPALSDADIPAPSDADIPAPSDADIPAPSDVDIPAPSDVDIPAPSDADAPAPSDADIPAPSDADIPAPSDADIPAPSDADIPAASDGGITAAAVDFTLTGVTDLDMVDDSYDTDNGQDHNRRQDLDGDGVSDPNLCMDKVRAIGTFTVSVNGTPVTVTGIDFDLRALKEGGSYPAFFSDGLGLFAVEPVYDGETLTAFNLSMRRWGHALGLSQRGAQQRAKPVEEGGAGQTYQDILSFYYPNTILETRNYKRVEIHTVAFETNGGNTKEPLAIRTYSIITAAPAATKTGYTLEGWYLDPEFTSKVSFPYTVMGDITLYANWNIETYTISYNLDGGKLAAGSENPPSYTIETPEFTLNNPTRAGYVFTGWTWTGQTAATTTVTIPMGSYGARSYTANWKGIVTDKISAVFTGYYSASVIWSGVEGAVGYEVRRATSSGGTYLPVSGEVPLTETAFADAGLTAGVTYYYKVAALFNDEGNIVKGVLSPPVRSVPLPPETVTAAGIDYDSIKISWSPAPGASGYMVYRSTREDGSYTRIATTTRTYYTNNYLSTGTPYYYKVRSYRGTTSMYGDESLVATATTNLMPMGDVIAKTYYPTSIKISWPAVPGRTGYEIYRSLTGEEGSFTKRKTTSYTYYNDTGLTIGQVYYYKVRAYRTISGKTVYNDYSKPANDEARIFQVMNPKAAMYSVKSNKITWSSVTGASGYEVRRCDTEIGEYLPVGTTGYRYFYDKTITPGQTYYYKVWAYRNVYTETGTQRIFSRDESAAAECVSKVAGIKAAMYTVNSNKISWNYVSGRTGYEVWWCDKRDGVYQELTVPGKVWGYTYIYHKGIDPLEDSYFYKVNAYQMIGGVKVYSGDSEIVEVKNKIAGLKAVAYSATSVKISWKPVASRTAYVVYSCDSAGNIIGDPLKTTGYTYYTNTGLIPNITYYYKVFAYQMINGKPVYTGDSDLVSVALSLKTVSGVRAARYNSTKIRLTWYSVSGASGYEIFRSDTIDGEYSSIARRTSTYYYDGGLETGKTYYYKILAYKTIGTVNYHGYYGGDPKIVSATP